MGVILNNNDDGWDLVEPSASPIFESLRAFGYTPETAIADLVDNSIAAKAKNIFISFQWNDGDCYVVVKDDGHGMGAEQLLDAMRLGSKSPLEKRSAGDLGRFGLGLKTASISQARELTVVSSDGFGTAVRRWDLDEVRASGQWRLRTTLPGQVIDDISFAGAGTAVIWTKCDRLVGLYDAGERATKTQFLAVADRVERHLALTFHRFLSARRALKIHLNGHLVTPWDPFLASHLGTWSGGEEHLPLDGSVVKVTSYVLPHKSKISDDEHREAAGVAGWNANQGFYVYRNDRLLVAGNWLGVGGMKEEHAKLARIALDFPVELDHHWQVDVRKSHVRPPAALVTDLRRIARDTKSKAQSVYRFRGQFSARTAAQDFVFAWREYKDRDGKITYRINRENPVVIQLMEAAPGAQNEIKRLLRFVEETLPLTQIAIHVADGIESSHRPFEGMANEVMADLEFLCQRMTARGRDAATAITDLSSVEPFSLYPEIVAAYKEKVGVE